MITPIVVQCTECLSGKTEIVLSEPIDCRDGYQVSLNTLAYSINTFPLTRSNLYVQTMVPGGRSSRRVYLPSKIYNTKHELISYINDYLYNLSRSIDYFTFRDSSYCEGDRKCSVRYFRNREFYRSKKWPAWDDVRLPNNFLSYELIDANTWETVKPAKNEWSHENFNKIYLLGGQFVFQESDEWLTNTYDTLKILKNLTESLHEFKSKYKYIKPSYNPEELGGMVSDNAKLLWYPYDAEKATELYVSKELAYLLGYTNRELDLPDPITHSMQTHYFKSVCVHRLTGLSSIFVFADFVEPTIIGPIQKSLLKIVPIQSDLSIGDCHIFEHEFYVNVERRVINKLQFYITASLTSAKPLEIHGSVTLVLYFRPIQ